MSFYNTGNPVPSIDPRDLDDNAKVLDGFTTSTEDTYVDRLGVERRTLHSINHDADAALLRSDLANPTDLTKGGSINGRATVTVPSILQLQAHPQRTDLRVIPGAYWPSGSTGGGPFQWNPTTPRTAHTGGDIISPTVPWNGLESTHAAFLLGTGETAPGALGCWERPKSDERTILEFGAKPAWVSTASPGFDNRWAVEAAVKACVHTKIPKLGLGYAISGTGSAFWSGLIGKRISGFGLLRKIGAKGIFSFSTCIDIKIRTVNFDGQITRDEAENGTIVDNSRLPANYAFAVSFANCHDCEIKRPVVYDFAWDGVVAQGTVDAGGATATQNDKISILHGDYSTIRGTHIWTKAIKNSKILHNVSWNPETFSQKANGIFAVEWVHDTEIAHNRGTYIGDNHIGVGEPVNNHVNARNRRLKVHHNYSQMTRYHALLIAQSEDSEYTYNTIKWAGAKTAMIGPSSIVQCGAITMLGGGAAPANLRNKIQFNTIIEPYEHGFYGFDRPGTLPADASAENEINGNTVTKAGTPPIPVGSTRLGSNGFHLQFQLPQKLYGNTVSDGIGDGFRVFGDIDVSQGGNKAIRCAGVGFNIPTDTIWSNTKLSSSLLGISAYDCGLAGIVVASKSSLSYGNLTAKRCGNLPAPVTETTANALLAAGVSFRSIGRLVGYGNICEGNGSAGMMTQFCPSIRDDGGVYDANGVVFTTPNFKAAAYCEGDAGNLVKAIFLQTTANGGSSQYYPIRILFGATDSVVLDANFTSHTSVSIGITAKNLINI